MFIGDFWITGCNVYQHCRHNCLTILLALMGDYPRSPTSDSYSILGLSKGATLKDIGKAYKSLVKKWHPDKHTTNKSEAQAKFHAINEAYKALNQNKIDEKNAKNGNMSSSNDEIPPGRSVDDNFFLKKPSFLSRSLSRRSKTPNPALERNASRSKTPTPGLDRNASRNFSSPIRALDLNAGKKSSFDRITSWNFSSSSTSSPKTPTGASADQTPKSHPGSLPTSVNRRVGNPIIYSQSTVRRKPPPIERKLECTLEELCHGSVKKIKITRDAINDMGMITREEEILKISIKPGWKKGTKVTFDGKGDEKPGTLPADIVFLIDEKKHPLFERDGDDLEIGVEVPLLKALTGCLLQVPLLGETEKMTVYIDDIIYPGYEKVIKGQGMPKSKHQGVRGDLKIKFLVEFPTELEDEQRVEAVKILEDCTWDSPL
uniref:J domain-containing protein n=1 Tax=Kalanchoe fedtschenkoi TaxID=63787 RepID=A0A7N0SV94_KALFE